MMPGGEWEVRLERDRENYDDCLDATLTRIIIIITCRLSYDHMMMQKLMTITTTVLHNLLMYTLIFLQNKTNLNLCVQHLLGHLL